MLLTECFREKALSHYDKKKKQQQQKIIRSIPGMKQFYLLILTKMQKKLGKYLKQLSKDKERYMRMLKAKQTTEDLCRTTHQNRRFVLYEQSFISHNALILQLTCMNGTDNMVDAKTQHTSKTLTIDLLLRKLHFGYKLQIKRGRTLIFMPPDRMIGAYCFCPVCLFVCLSVCCQL